MTVNYSNLAVSEYPLNNVSESGAFTNNSALWAPIPLPNLTSQGAGGPILPMLTTMVYTPKQASRARDVHSKWLYCSCYHICNWRCMVS